jgi:hypothetical protein
MKQIICVMFLLFIFSAKTFSQQVNPSLTKQDYLQKSVKQKKAAWIMLGGGAALFATGLVFPKGESKGFTGSFYGIPNLVEEYENDGIKAGFMLVGSLSMLGSIPVFLASGRNKRKAASLSFKNEIAPRINATCLSRQSLPSINLKISL